MGDMGNGLGALMALLAIVIAVLWIALPFAVFGIKTRLDRIIVLLERQGRDMRDM